MDNTALSTPTYTESQMTTLLAQNTRRLNASQHRIWGKLPGWAFDMAFGEDVSVDIDTLSFHGKKVPHEAPAK